MTTDSQQDAWTDWLASIGYGVDYSGPADPPCTLVELADAYVRVTGDGESREAWEWCITENTDAFSTPASTPEEGQTR